MVVFIMQHGRSIENFLYSGDYRRKNAMILALFDPGNPFFEQPTSKPEITRMVLVKKLPGQF
jgi:hypothetical protein